MGGEVGGGGGTVGQIGQLSDALQDVVVAALEEGPKLVAATRLSLQHRQLLEHINPAAEVVVAEAQDRAGHLALLFCAGAPCAGTDVRARKRSSRQARQHRHGRKQQGVARRRPKLAHGRPTGPTQTHHIPGAMGEASPGWLSLPLHAASSQLQDRQAGRLAAQEEEAPFRFEEEEEAPVPI